MLDTVISVRVAMSDAKIERKIAVIFATDVVGYSKHMEADENETIHSLRACEEILQKLFAKYDGRLFNTGGDSFLAEFSSAVSAVECAVEFHSAIQTRNALKDTTAVFLFSLKFFRTELITRIGSSEQNQGRSTHTPAGVCI